MTCICSRPIIFTNPVAQATPLPPSRAPLHHRFLMALQRQRHYKQRSFPVHSSMSETWCLCGKNAAHPRCLQVVRARGRGARVRRTQRQPQDNKKRGICEWKPSSVILKKLSPPPCATDQQGAACSDHGLLTKRQNPLSLLACLIYIKGSKYHCFLPLLSFEVVDESIKMD